MAGVERAVEVGTDRLFVLGAQLVAFDHAGAAVDHQRDGFGGLGGLVLGLCGHRDRQQEGKGDQAHGGLLAAKCKDSRGAPPL